MKLIGFASAVALLTLAGCASNGFEDFGDNQRVSNSERVSRDNNGGRHCQPDADGTQECWQQRALKSRGSAGGTSGGSAGN